MNSLTVAKFAFAILLALISKPRESFAEVAPADVVVPQGSVWVGQRIAVVIELRARGSFAGTASFDLPRMPGMLLMKIGNPVVGSKEIEGDSWFTQTHDFALYSQKAGQLDVPSFTVRFRARESFTDPAIDIVTQVPAFSVQVKRPPGSDGIGYLITTETFDVTESWVPEPSSAEVGTVYKRTIIQRASELSGIALAPLPQKSLDGIRIYVDDAEVMDKTQRGEFTGQRRETITYLLQRPGTFTLPAIQYVWWNPKSETLESKTLAGVTFQVTAASVTEQGIHGDQNSLKRWWWLLLPLGIAVVGIRCRHRWFPWLSRGWRRLNPADRIAARKLRRACKHNNAKAAAAAWHAWENTREPDFRMLPELQAAVLGLHRMSYGPEPSGRWQGHELRQAFEKQWMTDKPRIFRHQASLPQLNPQ